MRPVRIEKNIFGQLGIGSYSEVVLILKCCSPISVIVRFCFPLQMDMFLLGFTLGVKLEVVRPSRYGQEDYISHYPDEGADSFPKVYLVAEDNRHYNVLLP